MRPYTEHTQQRHQREEVKDGPTSVPGYKRQPSPNTKIVSILRDFSDSAKNWKGSKNQQLLLHIIVVFVAS